VVVRGFRRFSVVPLALCVALTLDACADPYADPASHTPSAPRSSTAGVSVGPGQPSGDVPPLEPTPAPSSTVGAVAAPSPLALARAYARLTANWDWRTLSDRLEELREQSAGPLSAELTDASRATRADESLARDRPASQGTVVAVSVWGAGPSRRLVVVTRERETASGVEPLGPATHRVYLGEARRTADGWRMVEWRRAP
jgi:hypothetical protein